MAYTKEYKIKRFCEKFKFNSLDDIPIFPYCNSNKVNYDLGRVRVSPKCSNPECVEKNKHKPHKMVNVNHELSSKKAKEHGKNLFAKNKSPLQHLTKDQRISRTKNRNKTMKMNFTPEQYSEMMSHISLSQAQECRSKASSKGNHTKWVNGNNNFQLLTKEQKSERAKKTFATRVKKGNMSSIISKIEIDCYNYLKSNFDENLVSQFLIKGLNHPYDMYSPKYNLIIEFDGDYYHRDKEKLDAR